MTAAPEKTEPAWVDPKALRETISELRLRLEQAEERRQREVQTAVRAASQEVEQLKDMAATFRQTMESERNASAALILELRREHASEKQDLCDTIKSLRDKLEEDRARAVERAHQERAASNREIEDLRRAMNTAKGEMEALLQKHTALIQENARQHQAEVQKLNAALSLFRDRGNREQLLA